MNKQIDQQQLGFDCLLKDAEADNRAHRFERETAHLPEKFNEAIAYLHGLIEQNHAAIQAADESETQRLHEDARLLALKLNGGEAGILAHENAPGYVLARETAAKPGLIPLWGQTGDFIIEAAGISVRIEMEGMFGIGSGWGFWPGFSARAVDPDKPFLSATGYRSFLGVLADPAPGYTPDSLATMIIEAFVERELRGKLVSVRKQPPKSGKE